MPADEKSFHERLVVLERNRVVDAVLRGFVGLGIVALVAGVAFHFPFGALGIHLAVISALIRNAALRQNLYTKPRERDVRASSTGVYADRAMIHRAAIADGYYQPRAPVKSWLRKRPAASTVQLFDRRKRMLFEAEMNETQASAMLRALGLDATQKRAEFRGASPLAATQGRVSLVTLAIIAGIVALGAGTAMLHLTPLLAFVTLMPLSFLMAWPAKIIVGIDGVLMKWLWRKRFLPMSEIATATADGSTRIRLELTNGTFETLFTASSKRRGGIYTQHRDLVLARIREAHRAHRELGPGADVATLVARGQRTPAEWKRALASLGENDASYRQAAIREEDLWRVVEDPRAVADARAGAARLLRKALDDEGRARVRVAAEATASPKLRVALEAATGPSDEALDEALEALAAEKT